MWDHQAMSGSVFTVAAAKRAPVEIPKNSPRNSPLTLGSMCSHYVFTTANSSIDFLAMGHCRTGILREESGDYAQESGTSLRYATVIKRSDGWKRY